MAIAKIDTSTSKVVAAAPAKPDPGEYFAWVLLGVAIITAAFLFSLYVLLPNCASSSTCSATGELFKPSSDYSILAGVLIATLAVERLLEPFSRFLGPDTEKAKGERDEALMEAKKNPGAMTRHPAAEKEVNAVQKLAFTQSEVDRARQITAVVMWAVATSVAMIFASSMGVLLIYAITAQGSASPPAWVDLLVTGLVVGAGTKPVHDLVSRVQQSKEKSEDPPQTQPGIALDDTTQPTSR